MTFLTTLLIVLVTLLAPQALLRPAPAPHSLLTDQTWLHTGEPHGRFRGNVRAQSSSVDPAKTAHLGGCDPGNLDHARSNPRALASHATGRNPMQPRAVILAIAPRSAPVAHAKPVTLGVTNLRDSPR